MQDHIMVGITNKCEKPVTNDASNMEVWQDALPLASDIR